MNFCLDQECIRQSCREFAGLKDGEIQEIIEVAKNLPYFVEANDGDVFIDIINPLEDVALVIGELYSKNSAYKASFMGDIIYRKDEPAVFQAFELNERVQNMVGISHDKYTNGRILSRQTVVPIRHEDRAVAVLILEKALDYETKDKPPHAPAGKTVSDILLSIIGLREEMEGHVREGILLFDKSGSLVYRNSMANKIYKEIGYQIIDSLHFDSLNLSLLKFGQLVERERLERESLEHESPERSDLFRLVHEEHVSIGEKSYDIRILITGQEVVRLAMLIDDYPYLYKYENEIKNHLVTYKEIHHRIKNNLQTIASLLRLQSYHCPDEYSYNALQSSINRIMSIAVTHDLLARRSGDKISVLEIVQRYVKSLEEQGHDNVKMEICGDDFVLDSQKSNTVLQVINELLQNSLKYAFPNRRPGKVTITVADEGDIKVIELSDDGVGYDSGAVKGDSLGLVIVKSYVEDILGGKLITDSGPGGTRTSFAFNA